VTRRTRSARGGVSARTRFWFACAAVAAFLCPGCAARKVRVPPPVGGPGTLGAELRDPSDAARSAAGLPEGIRGVIISAVEGDGAAAKAGLRIGDLITAVNDTPIPNACRLEADILDREGGREVRLAFR